MSRLVGSLVCLGFGVLAIYFARSERALAARIRFERRFLSIEDDEGQRDRLKNWYYIGGAAAIVAALAIAVGH